MEHRESRGAVTVAWVALVVASLALGANIFTLLHVAASQRQAETQLEISREQRLAIEAIERIQSK